MITIQFEKIDIGQLATDLKYWSEQFWQVKYNAMKAAEARSKIDTIYAQLSQFVTCKDCEHCTNFDDADGFYCTLKGDGYFETSICSDGDFEPIETKYIPTQKFQLF